MKLSVRCFCDESDADGMMICCEQCNEWQHAECVCVNCFSTPEHYVCPLCAHRRISCVCGVRGDFRNATIRCSICGKHQHKRHEFIGIGVNPAHYACSACRRRAPPPDRPEPVAPALRSYPGVPDLVAPRDIDGYAPGVPKGALRRLLSSARDPVCPADLIARAYSHFREPLFQSHPLLSFFEYHVPEQRSSSDALSFAHCLVGALSFALSLTTGAVTQILAHVISADIYKAPFPHCGDGALLLPQFSRTRRHLRFSERAHTSAASAPAPAASTAALPPLLLDRDEFGAPTVVADAAVSAGALIAEVYGDVSEFEEWDRDGDRPPHFACFIAAGTNLIVDAQRFADNSIATRIQRGFTSNCEVRLFRAGGDIRVGLFATPPTPLPLLGAAAAVEIAIARGEELRLPFDIPPPALRRSVRWRSEPCACAPPSADFFRAPPAGSAGSGGALASLFGDGGGGLPIAVTAPDSDRSALRVERVVALPRVAVPPLPRVAVPPPRARLRTGAAIRCWRVDGSIEFDDVRDSDLK